MVGLGDGAGVASSMAEGSFAEIEPFPAAAGELPWISKAISPPKRKISINAIRYLCSALSRKRGRCFFSGGGGALGTGGCSLWETALYQDIMAEKTEAV